ncbi:hypothetical protein HY416_02850 [Candidatus Kaiserbacteria bacterium]|nr:hypothetical protein [Candidatus Kaiserbacteria bacterium]
MSIKLGTLLFEPIEGHAELLVAAVALAIKNLPGVEDVGVAAIDPSLSDTVAFCEHYQLPSEQAANCVIVEGEKRTFGASNDLASSFESEANQKSRKVYGACKARRGEERTMAACVILASTRADVNGVVRRQIDAKKVSFAQMEKAVEESGMEYGAITPIGLPADWRILVDKAVADLDYVVIGSGVRGSKLAVPGSLLASLPNVSVIEGLAKPRTENT